MVERKKIGFRVIIFLIVLSFADVFHEEAHLGRRALSASTAFALRRSSPGCSRRGFFVALAACKRRARRYYADAKFA